MCNIVLERRSRCTFGEPNKDVPVNMAGLPHEDASFSDEPMEFEMVPKRRRRALSFFAKRVV